MYGCARGMSLSLPTDNGEAKHKQPNDFRNSIMVFFGINFKWRYILRTLEGGLLVI